MIALEVATCSAAEARALTDRIKGHADALWALLLEAHERRAWAALGYETWSDYVFRELNIQRSRSYQLIDQGRTIRAINAAVEVSTNVDDGLPQHSGIPPIHVTEWEARELKPCLPEVTEQVRERTNGAPPERVPEIVSEVVSEFRGAHVAQNSGQNEWYTPAVIIDAARATLGAIDLDPASHPDAQELIQATRYHTREDSGLVRPWEGRVWLNPPYAQPLIGQFCAKLVHSYRSGQVTAAITLTNNGTETEWGQTLLRAASAVCFPDGRVKFWAPDRVSAPLQGQMLCYLGPSGRASVSASNHWARCWERSRARARVGTRQPDVPRVLHCGKLDCGRTFTAPAVAWSSFANCRCGSLVALIEPLRRTTRPPRPLEARRLRLEAEAVPGD